LANTQYYGWALRNRAALLPTRAQLARAEPLVQAARERLAERMEIIYVVPDYYEDYPKPCMGGWGRRQLTVTPNGDVLPCPAASQFGATFPIDNVRRRSLAWIWRDSPLFNAFRGTAWMRDPCRSCPRRAVDFGGCRCQALQLTHDARATDPVCRLSSQRALIDAAVRAANANPVDDPAPALAYRWSQRRAMG
jgi:pyrroloquinoline quinone biosynthesis protein E